MADLRPVYVAGDGDVKGPTSSSNNFLPLFAGTTGKLLKSSGTGVTTQGLAILDDNTPAEQRNTIGLDQVDNTSDVNKPVSTAQQTALNLKANIASPTFTGTPAAPSAPKGTYSSRLATMFNLGDVENGLIAALKLKQDNLNYTPVQQGGGIGQGTNRVRIGWSNETHRLKVTVDAHDKGNVVFDSNTATESVVGVAKVATQALTDAGVDDETIVTPKKMRFGFQFIKGVNGAIVFPTWLGGWIIQWGLTPNIGNGLTASFNYTMPFPTAAICPGASRASSGNNSATVSTTLSQIKIHNRQHYSPDTSGTTNTYFFFCFGY